MWTYLVLFGILVIIVITMVCVRREGYMTTDQLLETATISTSLPTVVGGTVSSKLFLKDHSTVVNKLLGDNNKTVILLHNNPFNMEVWDPLFMYVQELKNSGEEIPNLICYDLLGHGTAWKHVDPKYNDANMSNMAWSFDQFSNDLYDVYQKYVGSGKVIVLGYGFGGAVAQYFALDYPEVIEHLYVVATDIGLTTTVLPTETSYMVKWIQSNPLVTYLTFDSNFVKRNLCLWFENSNPLICANPENANDDENTFNTVEYLLGSKLYREASSTTYFQISKLVNTVDIRPKWRNAKITYPVTVVIPDRDHYSSLKDVEKDMKIIEQASPDAKLYVVDGKHSFALMHPDFIYDLISGKDMSNNPLTLNKRQ